MIAKTERDAMRQAAIIERRRAFIERWAQPKIKRAYAEMTEVMIEQYGIAGIDRIQNNKDEVAAPMAKALGEVFERVNDTMRVMARTSGKAFGGVVESKAEEEDLGVIWEELQRAFLAEAFKQSKTIAETFIDDIVTEILSEVAENPDPQSIYKAMRSRAKELAPWKASMVARTEAGAAMSEAQDGYTKGLWDEVEDGPLYKKWHSVRSSRTRDDHRRMNGEVVPYDSLFDVGSGKHQSYMRYPQDRRGNKAQVINCRCSFSSIPEELVSPSDRTSSVLQDEPRPVQGMTIRGVEIGESKSADEIRMHNLARWNPESDTILKNGLKKSSPLDSFSELDTTEDGDPIGAYYMPSSKPTINIPSKQKRDKGGTARHEFGHHIDTDIAKKRGLQEDFYTDSKEVRKAGKSDAASIAENIPNDGYSYGRRQLELSSDYESKEELLGYAEKRFSGIPADLYKYTTDRDLFQDLAGIDDTIELNRVIAGMDPLHWGKNTDDPKNGPGIIRTLRNLARSNGYDFNQNTSLPRFSDTIENITYAEQGSGHGRAYYQPNGDGSFGRGLGEAFANYAAELGGPNPKEARRLMVAIFPNTVKVFDKGLREL